MEANQIQLKYINRRSALNYIRRNGTATKANLAAATGLTFAAIKKILDELEELELIKFSSIEKKSVGRNSVMYEVNADYRYVVSVYINRKVTNIAVVNLGGNIVSSRKIPMLHKELTQNELIENILSSIHEVIEESGITIDKFIGVGIGVPGPIDIEKGLILTPPNMPVLNYLPLLDIVESKLGLPVYMNKDTNVIALGEYWHGVAKGSSNLVYLDIDMGIGSGVVSGGQMNVGAEGKAGEFGHITIDINGPTCNCGNKGCLEAMGSGIAVLRELEKELETQPEHPLYEKRHQLDIDDVIEAVKNNDLTAISIINKAAFYVGVGVASLINFLDPEAIVLGGLFIRSFESSFPIIANVANQRMIKSSNMNQLYKSELGNDAGVVGAAEAVIDHFYQKIVNRILEKSV